MYFPQLKYAFCMMRRTSFRSQMSLIKYLNSFGMVPCVLVNNFLREEIFERIQKGEIDAKVCEDILDHYDVMFSESSGSVSVFEGAILSESKKQGKINLILHNAISIHTHLRNINYLPPENTKYIHGMCVKGQRSIDHYKKFTKDLFYLNTGDPDWDLFGTHSFKREVEEVQKKYGDKLLVLCAGFINEEEIEYYKRMILLAEELGFKVIVCVHPGSQSRKPVFFQEYEDYQSSHFILLKAASHIIENVYSTIMAESLFLGKRVGCTPAIRHFAGYGGPHVWVENYVKWYKHVVSKVGKEVIDLLPRIFTENELRDFLSSDSAYVTEERIDKIFGWPKVSNYSEHLFKMVEEKVKEIYEQSY